MEHAILEFYDDVTIPTSFFLIWNIYQKSTKRPLTANGMVYYGQGTGNRQGWVGVWLNSFLFRTDHIHPAER
jgi:hypothetical protein